MYRVLIINSTLVGEKSGTGNTLRNIFSVYPNEQIMQLCLQRKNAELNTVIENTAFVTKKFAPIPFFVSDVMNKGRKKSISCKPELNASTSKKNIKSSIHDFFRGLLDALPVNHNDYLVLIDKYKPDVIYTCGATIRIMKVAVFLSKRYNIKIILHLMDDWPKTLYIHAFSGVFRRILLHQLKICNDKSAINFAISGALAAKYSDIYKKEYLPLMNPASHIADSVCIHKKETVRFVYAGSISLNRWKSLLDIASVLDRADKDGFKNEFIMYVPPERLDFMIDQFKDTGANVFSYVSNDRVSEVYSSSDVLVFTESFDENIKSFIKYSLSTKIPEYMAAAKPILAYLDNKLFSANYLEEKGAACVANNKSQLYTLAIELIKNEYLRKQLAENCMNCAKKEHSLDSVKAKLYRAIQAPEQYFDKVNKE